MQIRQIERNCRTFYRNLKYKGTTYQCPYCNFKSNGFISVGLSHQANIDQKIIGAGVRNGGCVNCYAIERDRLLYAYFDEELKIFKDNPEYSILHLAPEWRLSNEFLKYKYKNYICNDKFTPGYSYPKHTIDMDIMNIDFPNNKFDLVICNHVLEHIPNDIGAMKELYRVLKPNGTAVLQVPISAILQKTYENPEVTNDEQRIEHYWQFDHVRIYGQDYVNRLQSVGFIVNRINISEKYKKYGTISEEDIFICKK